MIITYILTIFKRKNGKEPARFSDFFLYASPEQKKEIFREAAEKANKEQRDTFLRSRFETKIG